MKASTTTLTHSPDVAAIGGRTGLLWTSGQFCLAGKGVARRIPIRLDSPDSVSQACGELTALGATAFAALPFDRSAVGELIVPRIVVGSDGAEHWLTITDDDMTTADAIAELDTQDATDRDAPTVSYDIDSALDPHYWRDEVVSRAINIIKSGRLDKVVLARQLDITATEDFDIAVVLNRLHRRYSEAIRFNVDGFVGASPELLVSRKGEVVRAHPLAGTAPRLDDPELDAVSAANLEASTKDQWEHRITISWLLDNLLGFCSYVDAEPEPQIVSLANVHHLGTRVEGRLSGPSAHVLELVAALHPTPAVGGAPQDEALRVIAEIEQAERGRYAGPVGWVDAQGNGAFAVGIRSAQIAGNQARLFAGVGVVADSDPESELAETEAKFQAMRRALTVS